MKTVLLPALTLALILSACGSPGPVPAGDPAPLSEAQTQTELGGAVASDVEQTLAALSDVAGLGGLASCRTPDASGSALDADGRPLDSDADGVPDRVTWLHRDCPRGGALVSGQTLLSDPTADPALAGSFVDTASDLTVRATRADGSVRTAVKNGTSAGTLRERSALTIVRNLTETITDSAHPTRQARWKNQVTVQFSANAGETIDRRRALPAGTVRVDGPREWHVSDGDRQVVRYLSIVTTTPLAFDPTCSSQAERIFGSSHARSGAFEVRVYADAARTVLARTVTVTYTDCSPTISAR